MKTMREKTNQVLRDILLLAQVAPTNAKKQIATMLDVIRSLNCMIFLQTFLIAC